MVLATGPCDLMTNRSLETSVDGENLIEYEMNKLWHGKLEQISVKSTLYSVYALVCSLLIYNLLHYNIYVPVFIYVEGGGTVREKCWACQIFYVHPPPQLRYANSIGVICIII
mgnify:CR=1 FL=1